MNDNAIPMLEEITAPSSVDAADATDFLAVVELNNAVCLLESGVPDLASTPRRCSRSGRMRPISCSATSSRAKVG